MKDIIPDLHFHPIPSEHPDNETKKDKMKTGQNGGAMSHGGRQQQLSPSSNHNITVKIAAKNDPQNLKNPQNHETLNPNTKS